MFKSVTLTERIEETRSYNSGKTGPYPVYNITSNEAVIVRIDVAEDYSSEKIKMALSKIFEKAMQCW